ncbi:glycosyltransferase family 2 protein [Tenacibaculum maritimum]|uniref:glycosyltransferase family 2 protein n=1 Tax=Tenacibaculum maritimum TaxID=107401 RepID=UPI0012E6B5F8|nr:glycosyltransferase family 2 protein [Tenacibaculum maritimum]CAA0259034.1 Glycosyltransferase, family GT2 [Tenacibaculum maritimum]
MSKHPLVSIVTVSFNSAVTIKDTIEGVLQQTYPNIEYLIIDGKSTDTTLDIVKSYEDKFAEKKISYKWLSEKDNGIYDAYNKGVSLASGDIIGIINSDDWYNNNAIEEIIRVFSNQKFAIVSGEKRKVTLHKKTYGFYYNKKNIGKYVHKVMPLNFPATFIHKTVYNEIGLYDTQYKLSADYDLIFRAYKANASFLFTDKVIVNMRNSGATGQLSSLWLTAKEDQHIRKKNNVKWTNFYYLKRIIFNCLVIGRDTFKSFFIFKKK